MKRRDPLLTDVLARSNPFTTTEIAKLLRSSGLKFDDELRVEPFRKHFRKGLPRLRALQRIDLMTFSTDSCLFKVDRASMFHSLEVRVPFLDRRIIEWALSSPISPEEQQLKTSKPLLRRYVDRAGLSHVLNQPKSGFSMKGSELNSVSQDMIREVNDSWLVQSGFLDDSWQGVITGKHKIAPHQLWPLHYLAQWVSRRMGKSKIDHKVRPETVRTNDRFRAA
jgi:asparagine synthase (glutamine-hydrolysing)